jgi:hypothetical protein
MTSIILTLTYTDGVTEEIGMALNDWEKLKKLLIRKNFAFAKSWNYSGRDQWIVFNWNHIRKVSARVM